MLLHSAPGNKQYVTMYEKIGKPTRRKEDLRLLTGQGAFSDDFNRLGQAYAAMVRSPHPHAQIKVINTADAAKLPGVLGVFTGADCLADGLSEIPHNPIPSTKNDIRLTGAGGTEIFIGPHPPLPIDKVRHVGEAVAMVVAESREIALDAAEAVEVDYETLPAVTLSTDAAAIGATTIWQERPDNVAVDTSFGDEAATDEAFAAAAHEIAMEFHVDRVTGVPLEPRAALGIYDATLGHYTLFAGSGGAVRQKREMMAVLDLEEEELRVVSKDVGGNFGTRNRVYVEFPLVLWAARKIDRPVKFTCGRSEAFVSDYQGRDLVTRIELAMDAEGRFLGLRADNMSNVGARVVSLSPLGKGSALVTGPYNIPAAHMRARAVFTNTVPTQAYRSSGRPEVTFAIERLIDTAAAEFGFDRVELRRINLIASAAMPFTNPIGATYDSGEYALNMSRVISLADWTGFDARRTDSETRGKRLGLGIANYVESSTGAPLERATITVNPSGIVDVIVGTQPSGQGHETSFAQVAAEWLGVGVDQVMIKFGDTDLVKVGGGSHSGRSMRMAGTVIVQAAEAIIKKGRDAAAWALETTPDLIEFIDGHFRHGETNRTMDLFDAAEAAEGGLTVTCDNEMHTQVFPNGCHVCEVEVDPETGAVEITRYTAVDDVGRAINPMIVDGQTHGGIAQGVGQALWEQCRNDPSSGQPLAAALTEYGLPRADHFPTFVTELNEVPSPTNPLGVKAGGEGGTTPAPAVIINAIVDALRPFGVTDIKMPATPFRVWTAIQHANFGLGN
ncbi:MAG: xanthine dehydrogenase family protein molybdopterin-binding subunit [Rhodospirillaceae bacterium]|nr:xanthine dehydrogenase family protein molybdopterin-binding subunit [Rhodospirillaceae bacterium]